MLRKLALIIVTAAMLLADGALAAPLGNQVQTRNGILEGTEANGLHAYLGVPYAAPPLGSNRWRAPQPVVGWKGVRAAQAFGPSAPQPKRNFGAYNTLGTISEDCLYLNIWSPAKDDGERLPVMIWIHGGGFFSGSGSMSSNTCSVLARHGVVGVNLNYRLGALGFMAHPALSRESANKVSGNYGLLDQLAAIAWVRDNIAAFGGDPNNITIFGESAGGISVSMHMLSPLAEGLFQGVIAESGNPISMQYVWAHATPVTMAQGEAEGVRFARAMGCGNDGATLEKLRAKSWQDVISGCDNSMAELGAFDAGFGFGPVVDGWYLPAMPVDLVQRRKVSYVPMIIGGNRDEGGFVALLNTAMGFKLDDALYEKFVRGISGRHADAVLEMFSAKGYGVRLLAYSKLLTVFGVVAPARYIGGQYEAAGSPAYVFEFSRAANTMITNLCGATHTAEIPYVLGYLNEKEGYTKVDLALSEQMMRYWTNFARAKNPNGAGLPVWPGYTAQRHEVMNFGDAPVVTGDFYNKEYDLVQKVMLEQLK